MAESTAIFAGGCFWCLEPVFSQLMGVNSVVSGYTGGAVDHPTYKQVCTGTTGHAEAIQIHFDESVISYDELLDVFFYAHDPTTPNRQGNDIGTQYRSAVFCLNELQRRSVEVMIDKINELGVWDAPIVTQINDASVFYPAEDYHQYYYASNMNQPYCMMVAAPKIAKIRKLHAGKIKS